MLYHEATANFELFDYNQSSAWRLHVSHSPPWPLSAALMPFVAGATEFAMNGACEVPGLAPAAEASALAFDAVCQRGVAQQMGSCATAADCDGATQRA